MYFFSHSLASPSSSSLYPWMNCDGDNSGDEDSTISNVMDDDRLQQNSATTNRPTPNLFKPPIFSRTPLSLPPPHGNHTPLSLPPPRVHIPFSLPPPCGVHHNAETLTLPSSSSSSLTSAAVVVTNPDEIALESSSDDEDN